jgi:mercuric reductase
MKKHYKLIVIGGGAGGFAAVIKSNELKTDTLMVNSGLPIGGTCVNVGCVPSKYLLNIGDFVYSMKKPYTQSVSATDIKVDFSTAIQEELALVKKMREEKYVNVLKSLSYVDYIDGHAYFKNSNQIEVNGSVIRGDNFIISTGSTANIPQIEGIDDVGYITHVEALKLKSLPKKLLIIGAGPVAIEFAQMFRHLGSEVTMLVRSDRILKETEFEISELLEKYLKEEGIVILKNTSVYKFSKKNNSKFAHIKVGENEEVISFDEVLLGIGKTPNTASLSLENAGVSVGEDKAIIVSEFLQTSNPIIYAVGDVASLPKRYETTAGREGTLATRNILEKKKFSINYDEVPYAVFTNPAVAGVGLTDAQVNEANIECKCLFLSLDNVPKAHIVGDSRGLMKMIVRRDTEEVLGVHMISKDASDLIHEGLMIVRNHMTIEDILDSIHVFPTLSEVFKIIAQSYKTDISKLSCCV